MNVPEPIVVAARLVRDVALPRPLGLERLAGGNNNRVYRVDLEGGETVVLKLYHADPRDPRDRLAAEWSFLDYVWAHGVRSVPQPLARDASLQAGLYGFVPGRRLDAAEIDGDAVDQASDFVIAINSSTRDMQRLAPGSEACFSLAAHLATVDRRVARLDALDSAAPLAAEAAELVAGRLRPAWEEARRIILAAAGRHGIGLDAAVAPGCISPSDFGYHNALADGSRQLAFIDFEYAGRDDPAKLVCDFFCQPQVPVPALHFDRFMAAIAGPLGLSGADRWRCRALLPAYRIKWVCIILNEFLAVDASRRTFADPGGDRLSRARRQLDRASLQLDLLAT